MRSFRTPARPRVRIPPIGQLRRERQGVSSDGTPAADASWRTVLAPHMTPRLRPALLDVATSVVAYLALMAAMFVALPDLVSPRARAGDSRGRIPGPHLHRLPRLRARLVRALEARECDARRRAGRRPLHALCVVAPRARRPPRDDRRPRQEGRRRHPDPDRRRVPRPIVAGPVPATGCSATRS